MVIGIIDWYSNKGFGMIKSFVADKTATISDYFLHFKNIENNCTVKQGDIVFFDGDYDFKKQRSFAIRVCVFSGSRDQWLTILQYFHLGISNIENVVSHGIKSLTANDEDLFADVIYTWVETAKIDEILKLYQIILKYKINKSTESAIRLLRDKYHSIESSTEIKISHWQSNIIPCDWLSENDIRDSIKSFDDNGIRKITSNFSNGEIIVFDFVLDIVRNINYSNLASLLSINGRIDLINNDAHKERLFKYIAEHVNVAGMVAGWLENQGYANNYEATNFTDIIESYSVWSKFPIFVPDSIKGSIKIKLDDIAINNIRSVDNVLSLVSHGYLSNAEELLDSDGVLDNLTMSDVDSLYNSSYVSKSYFRKIADSLLKNKRYKDILSLVYRGYLSDVEDLLDSEGVLDNLTMSDVDSLYNSPYVNKFYFKNITDNLLKNKEYKVALYTAKKLDDEVIYYNCYNCISKYISVDEYFELWKDNYIRETPYDTIYCGYIKDTISSNEIRDWINAGKISINKLSEMFIAFLINMDITLSRDNFNLAKKIITLLLEHNVAINSLADKDGVMLINWIADIENDSLFNISYLRGKFLLLSLEDQIIVFKRLFYLKSMKIFTFNLDELNSIIYEGYLAYKNSEHFAHDNIFDLSTCIVLNALNSYSNNGTFPIGGELYKIFNETTNINAVKNQTIERYFDKCDGLRHIYPSEICGTIVESTNSFEITFDYNADIVAAIKTIFPTRKYNSIEKRWSIPLQFRELIIDFARKYNFTINNNKEYLYCLYSQARNNGSLRIPYYSGYYNNRLPTHLPYYCEGTKCQKQYRGFDVWRCRNMDCYEPCREYHNIEDWKKFTLLDFLKILEFHTDGLMQTTSVNNTILDGNYLQFVGFVNRFREVISHLYCHSCGKILLPVEVSNYNAYTVTLFRCYNNDCSSNDSVYINHCMNGYCNAIIDARDAKKCPNDWYICKECASCCDIDMAKRGKQSAEKRGGYIAKKWDITLQNPHNPKVFFCPECGAEMNDENGIYYCEKCKIKLKYRYDTFNRRVKGLTIDK